MLSQSGAYIPSSNWLRERMQREPPTSFNSLKSKCMNQAI